MSQLQLHSAGSNCSLSSLFHEIAPRAVLNTHHDVDFISSGLPLQYESGYAIYEDHHYQRENRLFRGGLGMRERKTVVL